MSNSNVSKSEESAPSLVFVTQNGGPITNKAVKTQIRKHVMKDIGKARRTRTRPLKPLSWEIEVELPDSAENSDQVEEVDTADSRQGSDISKAAPVNRVSFNTAAGHSQALHRTVAISSFAPYETTPNVQLRENFQQMQHTACQNLQSIYRLGGGRMDPFVKYPVEMDHRAKMLVDHVFDDRYGNTPPFRDTWFPVGMMDPASFNQVLSNASLNLAFLKDTNNPPETVESLKYHARAIQLVNERISKAKGPATDGIIGALVGFACYDHVIGVQAGWRMHMNGVKEMIRLRGGIEAIESNKLLRMILFWTDTCGAITGDVDPYFPVPYPLLYPPLSPPTQSSPRLQHILSHLAHGQEISSIIEDLLTFTTHLTQQVRITNGATYSDGYFAAPHHMPIIHRLSGPSSAAEDPILEAIRLSCIMYTAEIRRLFGIMGIFCETHVAKLRSCLTNNSDDWGELQSLRTWCLAMGAMESRGSEREWFRGELEKEKRGSWEGMEEQLKGILWYENVHTPLFREVYNGFNGNTVRHPSHMLGGSRFGGYRPLS